MLATFWNLRLFAQSAALLAFLSIHSQLQSNASGRSHHVLVLVILIFGNPKILLKAPKWFLNDYTVLNLLIPGFSSFCLRKSLLIAWLGPFTNVETDQLHLVEICVMSRIVQLGKI
ncbi:hypothetical protein BDZ94DRAFT_1276445 [Collybia nuda]|uniref:Uncharacterized protein n=1 Tax=Collybia nuda TaxID=64659 RepID=A0A9P6C8E8_9AGAR|nr:hypothetical protein BDZ94DRAFT_1276445 [Collybia nuda]